MQLFVKYQIVHLKYISLALVVWLLCLMIIVVSISISCDLLSQDTFMQTEIGALVYAK